MEGQDTKNPGRGKKMNENIQESRKVKTVKAIVKGYFAGALTGSFIHIVTSAEKMGGHGVEAYATPFMIDGLAVIGMIMRSEDFSERTNKIGFRVQCVTGLMSLAMNVYAAKSLFGVLFGIAVVACFILAEYLGGVIESREVDKREENAKKAAAAAAAAQAIIDAEAARVQAEADALAAKKAATQAKRMATIKRNKRNKAQQEKVLESLVNG